MSTFARTYCTIVILAGSLMLLSASTGLHSADPFRLAVYMLAGAVLATFKMRLPGLTATVSAGSLVVFASIAHLRLPEAILVAASVALGQCLWNTQRRPMPMQVAFSVATLVISAGVTYLVCENLAAAGGFAGQSAISLFGSAVYFLLNTSLLAGALAATHIKPPMGTWTQLYLWTFPHYMISALIGCILSDASMGVNWYFVLLAMPAVYLVNHLRLRAAQTA